VKNRRAYSGDILNQQGDPAQTAADRVDEPKMNARTGACAGFVTAARSEPAPGSRDQSAGRRQTARPARGVEIMFRKTMFALAGAIALGAAALSPTSASAWGFGHGGFGHGGWGHGGGWGPHFGYGPRVGFYAGYDSCWRDRWVPTPYGPVLRRVNVCY